MRIIEHRRSAAPAQAGMAALYLRQGLLLPPADALPPSDAETLIFHVMRLRLTFDLCGLFSSENVRLDLTARLALTILDPRQFYQDIVRQPRDYGEEELAGTLAAMLVTALRPPVAALSLEQMNANPDLRAWLETAVRIGLHDIDLEGRSGLRVEALEAYDLRCTVADEQRNEQGSLYLRGALAEPQAGHPLVDQTVLASLRGHSTSTTPISEAPPPPGASGQDANRLDTQALRSMLRNPPSVMRPELWRHALGAPVHTAPLCDKERVFIVTRTGEIHALSLASGAAAWPNPVQLKTAPGDGMLLASGLLWIGGHNGILYGLRPESGAIMHRISIGGRLSSAPVLVNQRLYLSVDMDNERWEDNAVGNIIAIDPTTGQRLDMWRLGPRGLRAQPTAYEQTLFVGDRSGTLYRLDLLRSRTEALAPLRLGNIVAPVAVDSRRKQLIIGGSYGVASVDAGGRVRAVERLQGNHVGVMAQPLVLGDTIFVGATDCQLHILHANDLQSRQKPFATGGPIATAPIAVRHLVVFGSNDGFLYALDAQSGEHFWSYRSGHPVAVAPAVTADDVLIAVDSQGNVNALRWCLTQYYAAVRLARESNPPRLEEAFELLMLAQDTDQALEVAEQARRWDVVARLATDLQLNGRAAQAWEHVAKTQLQQQQAASTWRKAAQQWQLAGEERRRIDCLLRAAELSKAPLLTLHALDLPSMMQGRSVKIHIRVKNLSGRNASHVHLRCRGHILNCDVPAFGLEGNGERIIPIDVQPTDSGSATLEFTLTYTSSSEQPQEPVHMQVRLAIAQQPFVQNNYYGPAIGGDGAIIIRGDQLHSIGQVNATPTTAGAEPSLTFCPYCREQTMRGLRCDQCGRTLE